MKLSVTQMGNYAALIPLVVLILAQFDIKLTENDAMSILAGFVALGGVFASIWGRYRQGDVSVLGVKKPEEDNR